MDRREFEELEREVRDRDKPFKHPDHPRPMTRREMLAQGFIASAAMVTAPSIFGLARQAGAQPFVSCSGGGAGGMVPFICLDLGGGVNIAGSNVLTGAAGGQLDLLSDNAYSRQGLPIGQRPVTDVAPNADMGLLFHPDSAFLKGIQAMASATTLAQTNGSVLCVRSDNDTQNNPLNPLYGIQKAGANGGLVPLIGTNNSDSGGRSVAPMMMIDPAFRPVRVASANDAMGLVDTGKLGEIFPDNPAHAQSVMNAASLITDNKLGKMTEQAATEQLIHCSFLDAGALASVSPGSVNFEADIKIVGDDNTSIFLNADLGNSKFRSTGAVMKMVCDEFAGAGCIAFGGYDYHDGTRATGERRDFEAGQALGAMLEYAARRTDPLTGLPDPTALMIYVFSDGSLSSDGQIDNTADQTINGRTVPGGGGKGVWRGDNSGLSAGMYLVFDPTAPATRPAFFNADPAKQQIGFVRTNDGSVETGALAISNNVEALTASVVLNYLAIHGRQGELDTVLGPGHALQALNAAQRDALISFDQLAFVP